MSDLERVTVEYAGGIEERPFGTCMGSHGDGFLFELREHTNFMPLAPGDVVVTNADLVVQSVHELSPCFTYEVLLHLPKDFRPFQTPTEAHPAMRKIAVLEEEWRNEGYVTRFSNFSFFVSAQTEDWITDRVLKHPFVEHHKLIRTPAMVVDYDVARQHPDLDGTGGGPWA